MCLKLIVFGIIDGEVLDLIVILKFDAVKSVVLWKKIILKSDVVKSFRKKLY